MALVVLPSETEMAGPQNFSLREALSFLKPHSYHWCLYTLCHGSRSVWSKGLFSPFTDQPPFWLVKGHVTTQVSLHGWQSIPASSQQCGPRARCLIPSNSSGLGTVNLVLTTFMQLCHTRYKIRFASYSKSISPVVSLGTRPTEIQHKLTFMLHRDSLMEKL